MNQSYIKTQDVTKIYHQGKINEAVPVRNVSLQAAQGSLTVICGPSGSGKTTLLSMIGCQVKPTSGEIILDDKRISKLPERFSNEFKRKHIGFVFQHYHLIPELSVLDNVTLPLLPTGVNVRTRIERADILLEKFDLSNRREFPVKELSGGEQQRVAISRALINGSTILLADEPTAHLDSKLTKEFMSLMGQLMASHYTIIIASHDPAVSNHKKVDQVCEMKDGELLK